VFAYKAVAIFAEANYKFGWLRLLFLGEGEAAIFHTVLAAPHLLDTSPPS